ncbi:Fe-S cluster assembly sulfur transfer protein SufU [Pyxidicoccus xibeiensis]|uniref:Fe-S cluster assembly sulfur transfer protein SufU n=1 Tax=Pyxidicoccus xibeiensis TaxID=2906759 RepID=UPI0020A79FBC|nr:SUF system NifU family Fe-S cluster assembly protein [Pyxidicoccus xibeiensis]MCP3139148.1 SUF system NifU family Fe-S cluster assembly protein [Pyxidicoccus xibeiensis]
MSSDLSDLYQEVVLEHSKRPRNYRVVEGHNREAAGHNPLCGDQLTVTLKVEGDVIRDIGFQGQGCAISKASASLMTGAVKDRTRAEAEALFERVHKLVTEGPEGLDVDALGKLAVLSGVSEFPARVKCASLAWHTLRAALEGRGEAVSTE